MIVFSCLSSSADFYGEVNCNRDDNVYTVYPLGVTISVIAFCGVMGFLVLDALFDNISSVQKRKYIVTADMAFSGMLLWLAVIAQVLQLHWFSHTLRNVTCR